MPAAWRSRLRVVFARLPPDRHACGRRLLSARSGLCGGRRLGGHRI